MCLLSCLCSVLLVLFVLLVVIVALYTMSLIMHFLGARHVFLSLQVHGSMTSHCGLLLPVMRVLCLEIIDLTLFMQLWQMI